MRVDKFVNLRRTRREREKTANKMTAVLVENYANSTWSTLKLSPVKETLKCKTSLETPIDAKANVAKRAEHVRPLMIRSRSRSRSRSALQCLAVPVDDEDDSENWYQSVNQKPALIWTPNATPIKMATLRPTSRSNGETG